MSVHNWQHLLSKSRMSYYKNFIIHEFISLLNFSIFMHIDLFSKFYNLQMKAFSSMMYIIEDFDHFLSK